MFLLADHPLHRFIFIIIDGAELSGTPSVSIIAKKYIVQRIVGALELLWRKMGTVLPQVRYAHSCTY